MNNFQLRHSLACKMDDNVAACGCSVLFASFINLKWNQHTIIESKFDTYPSTQSDSTSEKSRSMEFLQPIQLF